MSLKTGSGAVSLLPLEDMRKAAAAVYSFENSFDDFAVTIFCSQVRPQHLPAYPHAMAGVSRDHFYFWFTRAGGNGG